MNPNDLTTAAATPVEVTLDGVAYRVGPLKIREMGMLQAWVKSQVPHPIEAVKPHLAGLPEAVQIAAFEAARQEARGWPPQVGSPEANRLFGMPEGEKELLHVILTKYQPHLTRDETNAVAERVTLAEFSALAEVAFGAGVKAPKAGGPGPAADPGAAADPNT